MMNLWNLKNLPQPPVCTYKVHSQKIDLDIGKLHSICEECQSFFKKYPHLHIEHLLLSRIIYRMKQKFRTSKDFKHLEKLNKSLQRYFDINLSINLQNLMDLIPLDSSDEIYLPTKNLVDFILVRLQGIAKLMVYIIETCKDVAYMLNIRIHTGHFWKIGFILFSIVSRIYILSRFTLKSICSYYSQLLPYSRLLKNLGKDWLPESCFLPQNLELWLDVDFTKMDQDIKSLQESTTAVPDIIQYFNLIEDSDSDLEITDEFVYINDKEPTVNPDLARHLTEINIPPTFKVLRGFTSEEDTGEIITLSDNDSVEFIDTKSDHNHDTYKNKVVLNRKDKKKKKKLKMVNKQVSSNLASGRGENKIKHKKLPKKLINKTEKTKSKVSTNNKKKKKKQLKA